MSDQTQMELEKLRMVGGKPNKKRWLLLSFLFLLFLGLILANRRYQTGLVEWQIPISKPSFETPDQTPGPCPPNSALFDDVYFSICHPERLKLGSRDLVSSPERDESVQISFFSETGSESLVIKSDFTGGWGPSRCETKEAVKVAGYGAQRYTLGEVTEEGCGDPGSFITIVEEETGTPYIIIHSKGDGTFSDSSEYVSLEQSLKIKKP